MVKSAPRGGRAGGQIPRRLIELAMRPTRFSPRTSARYRHLELPPVGVRSVAIGALARRRLGGGRACHRGFGHRPLARSAGRRRHGASRQARDRRSYGETAPRYRARRRRPRLAADHSHGDIGGTRRADTRRQVLVVGARGDQGGVAWGCRLDGAGERPKGRREASAIACIAALFRADIPDHGATQPVGKRSRTKLSRRPSATKGGGSARVLLLELAVEFPHMRSRVELLGPRRPGHVA